jgi:hypothetical protein
MSSIDALFARYGPAYRWLATGTVMISTIAVVLSTTIVNVAIPDVMGAFGIRCRRSGSRPAFSPR